MGEWRNCMNLLDFREPVSAWSHCAGLVLAVPGTVVLWRRSGGNATKRLSLLVYGLTLTFCYLASTLFHGVRLPATGIAALRPPGRHGDLRPDRGQLYPAGLVPDARPLAVVDPGCRLGRGGHGYRPDRDRPALLARVGDRALSGDGVGRRRLLFRDSHGSCRTVRCCPSFSAACPTAWGQCSTCCTGRSSCRGSSGPTSCSTCSCWWAAWPTTVHPQGRRAVCADVRASSTRPIVKAA